MRPDARLEKKYPMNHLFPCTDSTVCAVSTAEVIDLRLKRLDAYGSDKTENWRLFAVPEYFPKGGQSQSSLYIDLFIRH